MATTNLGRVRFNMRGDYNPAADPLYSLLDLVSDGGGSFVYINGTPSNEPTSSTSHWQQIASIGGQDLVDAAVAARDAAQAQAALAQGYAAQLAAGTASPAGTYANLAALNSGTPTTPNVAKIYITLDDGNWCYHNGTAWVAGGVYQAVSVAQDIASLESTVGDGYWQEILYKQVPGYAETQYIDLPMNSGDVVKMDWDLPLSGKQLTVVTYTAKNMDYLIQSGSTALTGSVTKTLTTDCTQIKVNTNAANVILRIMVKTLSEESVSEDLHTLDLSVGSITQGENEGLLYEDSVGIGEAVLSNNDSYNTTDFMRIVSLDNNYKYFSVANIKRIIDSMASVDLNYLELGFGGSGHGNCFQLDDMTVSANGTTYDISDSLITDFNELLTEADMDEIISYARANGIEIIPSLNMPGHMSALLHNRNRMFGYEDSGNSLDIESPSACNFAIAIAKKYAKWFAERGCKFYNLCADEFGGGGGYVALRADENYAYVEFINSLALALSRYGFTLFVWNDPVCLNGDVFPRVNRRLVVNYWLKREGGASVATIVQAKHRMINSSASIYWVANGDSVTEEGMENFDIHTFADGTSVADPLGAKFCIWIGSRETPKLNDQGTAITNTVLPLIVAFGETIAAQLD